MDKTLKNADEYVASFGNDEKTRLNEFRSAIKSALPEDTEEVIRWGMPTYRVGGKNILSFAIFDKHIGLFVGAQTIDALGSKLDGYKTSKAVIHIPHNKPLPKGLVKSAAMQSLTSPGFDAKPRKRPRHPMPDFVANELKSRGLDKEYVSRPPYQRNDYIGWINEAKQDATKQKRLNQMLDELEAGNKYMGMDYKSK